MTRDRLALAMGFFVWGCTTIQHADQVVVINQKGQAAVRAGSVPVHMVFPDPLVNQLIFPGYVPSASLSAEPVDSGAVHYGAPPIAGYQHAGYGVHPQHSR